MLIAVLNRTLSTTFASSDNRVLRVANALPLIEGRTLDLTKITCLCDALMNAIN